MKNNKGVTLVELLVTIGLIAVITVFASDFLFNLISASARIQNKITLEQNYTFVSNKLVKMIQDADSVTVGNLRSDISVTLDNKVYRFAVNNNQQLEITDSSGNAYQLNDLGIKIVISGSEPNFSSVNALNPTSVRIKMDFIIAQGTKLEEKVSLDRIVTVRKSYKN